MKINGTPQPGGNVPRKKLSKPVKAAGSGGAAGSSCAVLPDPQSMTAADAMVSSLAAVAVLAVVVWAVVALVAWAQRGERR